VKAGRLVGPHTIGIENVSNPIPSENEVLINLKSLSICGSDMRYFRAVLPEENYPLAIGKPSHECAGVVIESRNKNFKAGQRVIVLPINQDGLAELVVSNGNRLIALPDKGDLSTLVMCQPIGTVLYACERIGSVVGKTVVVLGVGAIGLVFCHLLSMFGAKYVVSIDPIHFRLDKSLDIGATHSFDPVNDNVINEISKLTNGHMADIVVEAAGTPETVNLSIDLVKKQGIIVLFGIMQDTVIPFEHYKLTRKYPILVPTVSSATDDPTEFIKKAVKLVEQNRLDISWLVTHQMNFTNVQKAYDMYDQRSNGVIKIVINT